jgi:hypothetical protein
MSIYNQKIVVFVDILGFSSLLDEFEKEAVNNSNIEDTTNYHQSTKLNKLIDIIRDNLSLVKKDNFNYYIFSDNICITADYFDEYDIKPDIFIDILMLISRIFYEFLKEGYFLRGGVDIGWFTDEPDFAIGKPLANAYILESKKAVYPRIILSDEYLKTFLELKRDKAFKDDNLSLSDVVLIKDSEYSFVNYFNIISRFEDKETLLNFLRIFKSKLSDNLKQFKKDKSVLLKYQWLKKTYNKTLKEFTNDYTLYNQSLILNKNDFKKLKKLHI